MKMKSAIFCVQNYGAFEGDQHEFVTDETHGTLVTKWRAGWACLMLTPAPNGRELNWKRDQIKMAGSASRAQGHPQTLDSGQEP